MNSTVFPVQIFIYASDGIIQPVFDTFKTLYVFGVLFYTFYTVSFLYFSGIHDGLTLQNSPGRFRFLKRVQPDRVARVRIGFTCECQARAGVTATGFVQPVLICYSFVLFRYDRDANQGTSTS